MTEVDRFPALTRLSMILEAREIDEELEAIGAEVERLRLLQPPTQAEIDELIEIDRQNMRRGLIDDSHWKARGLL